MRGGKIVMDENKKVDCLDQLFHTEEIQQQRIEAFFKEETTWCPEHVLSNFLAGFFLILCIIFQMIPYQSWDMSEDKSTFFVMSFLGILGAYFYIQKYSIFNENGKQRNIGELLRYLPVSYKQLYYFRLKKIIRLCIKLTVVGMFFQTMFALSFMHGFSAMNLLWPLSYRLFWCYAWSAPGILAS